MIIIKLIGGLGNQMFQYAAGRYLSEKHKTDLKLDLTLLLDRTPRKDFVSRDYNLNLFHIQECFARSDEIAIFDKYHRVEKIFHKISKLASHLPVCVRKSIFGCRVKQFINWGMSKFNFHLPVYICENPNSFDPRFFYIPSNAYIEGYWQSEKYFSAIESIIRKEYTFRVDLDEHAEEIANKISTVNSVCIHVRRGDYVFNPNTNLHHGVCEISYFEHAIEIISKKVRNPHFFIFSDDIDWCQTNLRLDYPSTLVSHENASQNFGRDLQLMIRCQHYIISNSSYSWWGAWLNSDPKKIVIAPQQWCQDPLKDTSNVLPTGWIKI